MGYVNRNETVVIKPQFDRAFDFHNGVAFVTNNNQSSYIDKKGKTVWHN
jgi:hypothetical protein